MLVAGQTPEENFRTLHAAGCIQTLCDVHPNEERALAAGYARFCKLMVATSLNPCDGCPDWIGCKVYKQYNTVSIEKTVSREAKIKKATTADNGPFGSMSVKQIAKKHNLSISQVRRLKVQGRLDTLLEKP